ncbi:DUF2510 domain-containing protein [Microbacterium sp. NPDC058345]|uniref:DUF2510 domain-containing protein n=1 Tax=Microbacterium sp. NPDC058345 TaxID=3346455 RepID=UPI0036549D4C
MSTPAGWYDDGSGRQRWWDGTRWTENFAPVDQAQASASATAPEAAKPAPTLGFVGLGLAVLGTILACIPSVATFVIGIVVLLAAFVVSLIAVFKKNTKKWPSIVGIALSIVGGVIGAIVFSAVLFVSLVDNAISQMPTDFPTSATSEQPSGPPSSDEGEGRPTPEAIGAGYLAAIQAGGITDFDDEPEFIACMGQYFYDSDLSDDALWLLVEGQDVQGEEAPVALRVTTDGVVHCGTQ